MPGNDWSGNGWTFRVRLFLQRFWQPTSACLTCMPATLVDVVAPAHLELALRTGLLTGALVVLLSFTRFVAVFRHRYANAVMVGLLTAIGDSYAHENHYGTLHAEAVVTGLLSGVLALTGSFVFEDRARRPRALWARWRSMRD